MSAREGIPASIQRRVRERAQNRCEYCRIAQIGQEATFHIDHVRPRRDAGPTALENLALSCVSCSLRKGAKTSAPDPTSGRSVPLFNPRNDVWSEGLTENHLRGERSEPRGGWDPSEFTSEGREVA